MQTCSKLNGNRLRGVFSALSKLAYQTLDLRVEILTTLMLSLNQHLRNEYHFRPKYYHPVAIILIEPVISLDLMLYRYKLSSRSFPKPLRKEMNYL